MTGNPRNLLLGAAVLLALLLFWPEANNTVMFPDTAQQETLLQSDFDYYLDGVVTHRFTGNGSLASRLVADRVIHFPDGDRAELTAPEFTRYPENQAPIRVSSKTGLLVPGSTETTDLLELNDEVILARELDSGALLTARTSSLQLDTGSETATTAAPVILESGRSQISGIGMKITLTNNRIDLLADVRGHHE
jgi:LPS export ABC transporter protein LptC